MEPQPPLPLEYAPPPKQRKAWRILLIVVGNIMLLPVVAVCVFGFLASFEPGADPRHLFKVIYGAVGITCIGTAGWLTSRRWG